MKIQRAKPPITATKVISTSGLFEVNWFLDSRPTRIHAGDREMRKAANFADEGRIKIANAPGIKEHWPISNGFVVPRQKQGMLLATTLPPSSDGDGRLISKLFTDGTQ